MLSTVVTTMGDAALTTTTDSVETSTMDRSLIHNLQSAGITKEGTGRVLAAGFSNALKDRGRTLPTAVGGFWGLDRGLFTTV